MRIALSAGEGTLQVVTRAPLWDWVIRAGLSVAIVGIAVVGVSTAQAQEPPELSGNSLVPVPGATPQAARKHGQVPCEQIISRLNRATQATKGRAATVESQKARQETVASVAKQEGTTQLWVAQCMRAYGRRVPENLENMQNEDVVEEFEEQEPEESASEDVSEPGAHERASLADENSQDRKELRADNPNQGTQEKETQLKLHLNNGEQPTGLEWPEVR